MRDFAFGAVIGALVVWLILRWNEANLLALNAGGSQASAAGAGGGNYPVMAAAPSGGGCGCGGGASSYVPVSTVPYTAPSAPASVTYSGPHEGFAPA